MLSTDLPSPISFMFCNKCTKSIKTTLCDTCDSVEVLNKYNSHFVKPGMRFGRLITIRRLTDGFHNRPISPSAWMCMCSCGKEVRILRLDLLNGARTACYNCHKESSYKAKLDNSFFVPYEEVKKDE